MLAYPGVDRRALTFDVYCQLVFAAYALSTWRDGDSDWENGEQLSMLTSQQNMEASVRVCRYPEEDELNG